MAKVNEGQCLPDKRLAAVCGLFCPACTLFIGTQEDPERLQGMAARMQRPLTDVECHGCRSEKRCFYCKSCNMTSCAAQKGVEFCGDCAEFPCEEMKVFQAERPHRIELWQSQARIKEVGYEQWYREMMEHYSCPACGAINSAYDLACRKCGVTPGCNYVKLHQEAIIQQTARRK